MSEIQTSQFRFYSLGIAASNLELGSVELEVTPIESLPMLEGELSQLPTETVAKGSDSQGGAYQEEFKVASSVRARWRSIGSSNRMTPPNVRRGEELIIYQVGDADSYYWDTLNNLGGLRKLETVVYAFSATKDETVVELTPDNSYVLELSTHDGKVSLTTSKANGEAFSYRIELDTKRGNLTITDNVDNQFVLDSGSEQLRLANSSGNFIDLLGSNLTIETKAKVSIKTESLEIQAKQNMMACNTTHAGNFNTTAGAGGSTGEASFSADIITTKDVVASGVSLIGHRHQDSGGDGIGGVPVK